MQGQIVQIWEVELNEELTPSITQIFLSHYILVNIDLVMNDLINETFTNLTNTCKKTNILPIQPRFNPLPIKYYNFRLLQFENISR